MSTTTPSTAGGNSASPGKATKFRFSPRKRGGAGANPINLRPKRNAVTTPPQPAAAVLPSDIYEDDHPIRRAAATLVQTAADSDDRQDEVGTPTSSRTRSGRVRVTPSPRPGSPRVTRAASPTRPGSKSGSGRKTPDKSATSATATVTTSPHSSPRPTAKRRALSPRSGNASVDGEERDRNRSPGRPTDASRPSAPVTENRSPPTSPHSIKHGHYEYVKLTEVHRPRQAMDKTYINVYGVFMMAKRINANTTVIELRDESVADTGVPINVSDKVVGIPLLEFGDVVRIHRLLVDFNGTSRIYDAKSVAVFKGFSPRDGTLEPQSSAASLTLVAGDFDRRRQLDSWLADRILSRTLSGILDGPRYTSLAGRVLAIVGPDSVSRATLALCDGTATGIETIDPIQTNPNNAKLLRRNGPDLAIAKRKRGLVFVTIYDQRAQICRQMPIDSIVVLNNVDVTPNRRIPTQWDIALRGNEAFGKCLRIVSPDSELAIRLRERVTGFLESEPDPEPQSGPEQSSEVPADPSPAPTPAGTSATDNGNR